MKNAKILSLDNKNNGVVILTYVIDDDNKKYTASLNTGWQEKEVSFLQENVGKVVKIEVKQNKQYTNVVKVEMLEDENQENMEVNIMIQIKEHLLSLDNLIKKIKTMK